MSDTTDTHIAMWHRDGYLAWLFDRKAGVFVYEERGDVSALDASL